MVKEKEQEEGEEKEGVEEIRLLLRER